MVKHNRLPFKITVIVTAEQPAAAAMRVHTLSNLLLPTHLHIPTRSHYHPTASAQLFRLATTMGLLLCHGWINHLLFTLTE